MKLGKDKEQKKLENSFESIWRMNLRFNLVYSNKKRVKKYVRCDIWKWIPVEKFWVKNINIEPQNQELYDPPKSANANKTTHR